MKGIVRSDHLAILIHTRNAVKPLRKTVYFRDVREQFKIKMENKLKERDWSNFETCQNSSEKIELLNDMPCSMFEDSFLLRKVKVSSCHPPYMLPLVKHLCNSRNQIIKHNQFGNIFIQENKKFRLKHIFKVFTIN